LEEKRTEGKVGIRIDKRKDTLKGDKKKGTQPSTIRN